METLETVWKISVIILAVIILWPHKDITKVVDGVKYVYLRRYYIWRSKWVRWLGIRTGNIYLHFIIRPDDDPDPHDHPWDFTTFVLLGGYKNETWFWNAMGKVSMHSNMVSLTFPVRVFAKKHRKAEHTHRVVLYENESKLARAIFGVFRPAVTFVITSPVKRSWGFITKDKGFVNWWIYLGSPEPTTKQILNDDL